MNKNVIDSTFILGTDTCPEWFSLYVSTEILKDNRVVGYILRNGLNAMIGDTVSLLSNGTVIVVGYTDSLSTVYSTWKPNAYIPSGETVVHEEAAYRTLRDVQETETREPSDRRLKATYKKVHHEELPDDTIVQDITPFQIGMNCYAGRKYIYEGNIYLCKQDILMCMFSPKSGTSEWEKV